MPIVNPLSPIPIQKEFSENSNTPITNPKDSPHDPDDQRLPELRSPPKQGETMKSLRRSSPPMSQPANPVERPNYWSYPSRTVR